MSTESFSCPVCGAPHEWTVPLPSNITCGNCQSTFSPVDEIRRYTLHLCRPGEIDGFIESHYSGRPFVLPRKGDRVNSKYLELRSDEELRIVDVEFEFSAPLDAGASSRQVIFLLTEVTHKV